MREEKAAGRASGATAYDGRRAAVLAVVGVTLLVSLLVTWAASIGPGGVLRSGGFADFGTPSPTTSSSSAPASAPAAPPTEPGDLPAVLQVLMVALFALFGLALLGLLVVGLRLLWHQRLRWRRRAHRDHVDFDVLSSGEAEDALAAAMTADASTQLAVLGEGSPRNGIVACWARFEEQAAEAGVRPRAWETSSEFALRILEMVQAETSAVSALAELFREARYSEHEVTEAQRSRAIAMLGQIHASLGRRVQRSGA